MQSLRANFGRSRRGVAASQRRAQFLLDFIEAENSMGFHAGQEAVRILALSIDEARRRQVALSGLEHRSERDR